LKNPTHKRPGEDGTTPNPPPVNPGHAEEAPGLPLPLKARKNQRAWACWVSAAAEVPFRVEGYDDDVDGRIKDNMEVFGHGVRSGASSDCGSAARWNGRLENVPFAFGFEGRKRSVMEEKAAAASNTCAGGDFSEDV